MSPRGPTDRRETYLGTISPGASVAVESRPAPRPTRPRPTRSTRSGSSAPFRRAYDDRPENQGEIRLVAWSPSPLKGQKVEPAVDRHRGFTAVVVHLRDGPPPSPDGPLYNRAAARHRRISSGKESVPR